MHLVALTTPYQVPFLKIYYVSTTTLWPTLSGCEFLEDTFKPQQTSGVAPLVGAGSYLDVLFFKMRNKLFYNCKIAVIYNAHILVWATFT